MSGNEDNGMEETNGDSFGKVKQRFKDRTMKVVQTKEMLSKQADKIAKQAEEHERFINKATHFLGVIAFGTFCFLLGARNTEMPDAMEAIFQSALALGRNGAVDEYMGHMENAANLYSKAVQLLVFLLVEGPSLIINPPFSLTNSDRYRLRTYVDVLNNRQSHSKSQRMALLKCEDQNCPP